jgi:hypothetical protein
MCGLFGFIGDAPQIAPLMAVLNGVAVGSLGWGIAVEVLGEVRSWPGQLTGQDAETAWTLMKNSTCWIGHSSLADRDRVSQVTQPLVDGRTAVSHDGGTTGTDLETERLATDQTAVLLRRVCASHGDLGVRVLAAMQQLPPRPHSLLVMEPRAIVAARQSERACPVDAYDGSVKARRQGLHDANPLFFAQREEGTYFCSRLVLDDMCEVEGVETFRRFD